MNGIVEVQPNIPLNTMVSNYGKHAYRLWKKRTVGTLQPKSSVVPSTERTFEEILETDTHSEG